MGKTIDVEELSAFLRLDDEEWAQIASDWVLDNRDDPRTQRALKRFAGYFCKKRLSSHQVRLARYMIESWHRGLGLFVTQHDINFVRDHLPGLVALALTGKVTSSGKILEGSVFDGKPTLREIWLDCVREMMTIGYVSNLVYTPLRSRK